MSQDDKTTPENKTQANITEPSSKSSSSKSKPWFDTPAPVKRLFGRFPLQTYAPNHLPLRTAVDRSQNNLYIFTTDEAAGSGAPSFNPSCLKWQLYALYLTPSNFDSVAKPRYILPTCSNPLVRQTISYQLRQAAATELLKQSPAIDVGSLFRDAEKAWEALSELLGNDGYFFAEETPGLFDASVFAYTHLLLSETMRWEDKRLANALANHDNLVRHSERISQKYFERIEPA